MNFCWRWLINICQLEKKRIRKNTSPWMNSDIFKLMKKRDKAKKLACKNKDKDLMDNYRILRNKVTAEVKKMKKMYYINKLQNTEGNPAQAWKTLKTLLPNKGTSNSVHSSDEKIQLIISIIFS